jgi:hypothetical protein
MAVIRVLLVVLFFVPAMQADDKLSWTQDKKNRRWALSRTGGKTPLMVFNLPEDGRPFLHPLLAPDGDGILTEYSPGHHKHQTGLYVGFVKINGRDYFHNRGKEYFMQDGDPAAITESDKAAATLLFKTQLLSEEGKPLLTELQDWTIEDRTSHYILDLALSYEAKEDVTFAKHDYGGVFLRMPWRAKGGGKATNSEGDVNDKAEGKKAKWVDVGMPIAGRKNEGRIAILDHKDNPKHPVSWRVDGQLGVGPAPSRDADWKIEKGKNVKFRYRFVVYTGEMKKELLEEAWKEFVGS